VSFLTLAALAVGFLVVAPLVAHLLRRRPPEELPFAATELVPATTAVAQRRTAIEDRSLFAIRSLAVLALAILGATPFVKCSRLSLAREGGASVALAIVIDDSMSMRAALDPEGGENAISRFERARAAAGELLEGMHEGDAVAIVAAGRSPRVVLAATTNLDAARVVLDSLREADRGTDLEGAVQMAGELLADLQHIDKRVVVLSDLADGGPEAPPLGAPEGTKLWVPLPELRGARDDCAVVAADRRGAQVTVRLACSPGIEAKERRRLEIRAGEQVIVEAPVRIEGGVQDVALGLGEGGPLVGTTLFARLTGTDAIAADDEAPVVSVGGKLRAGVVSDATEIAVATGGPPPVEQAFGALELGVQVQPLSSMPDSPGELGDLALLIADDVPGFTPSQRRELEAWVTRGGVLLVTIGPNAAAAPLGQSFEPLVPALLRWTKAVPPGIDRAEDALFADAGAGLEDLAPKGRAELELASPTAMRILVRWNDGAPFLLERRVGRGLVMALTLPFDTRESDLALRPGFLELLTRLTETARTLGGVARTTAGTAWTLEGFDEVEVKWRAEGDRYVDLRTEAAPTGRTTRAVPELAGLYLLRLDGNETTRVAAVDEREVDMRPRKSDDDHAADALGGAEASIDVSAHVAVVLLALMLFELLVRLIGGRRAREPAA
jgi:hypothetical protein